MVLRGLLFDYGGTLDGPASHWLDRTVDLYREAGSDLPFERIKKAFYEADDACYAEPAIAGAGLRELMEFHIGRQLAALGTTDARLHRFLVDRFLANSRAALADSREILQSLAGRFRLGVVSNFYGNVERILAEAGIAPLLSVIVDSHRLGISKPDPGIYTHAVAALGVPAGEVMHVGDSYERDVLAAREAGLRTAWLVPTDRPSRPPSGDAADLRIKSLPELTAFLAGVSA